MRKRMITMTMVGVMAVSAMGGTSVFAAQQKSVDVKNSSTKVSTVTSTVNQVVKEIKSLSLNYDNTKFELVQFEGKDTISLMDKADAKGRNYNVFISWQYADSVTAKKAANDKLKEIKDFGGEAKIEKSDLTVESIKVVDKFADGSSMVYYFISDNDGGVYKVFVNTNAFSNKAEMADILNSLRVDTNAADTMKIKKIAPCLG